MKVVVIEDESIAADYLEKLIYEYDPTIQVMAKLDSVSSSVIWLQTNHPDLIFLDIHLADDISFKIFEQADVETPVIFTTAYDQYAIKAFKLNSIDYLLKPIDKKDLFAALDKFKSLRGKNTTDLSRVMEAFNLERKKFQERFLVSTGQKLKSIPAEEIAYFYAEQKMTFLVDRQGRQFILDSSLDKLESLIDPEKFFRINRQFIVSFSAIKNMLSYSKSRVKLELEPACEKDTIVSVERSAEFKAWLNR